MLQTAHIKYKWLPYATEWNPPWKFSAYATGCTCYFWHECHRFAITALNHAAAKDAIFAEHITYGDPRACCYLRNLFNMCIMPGKPPQWCMKTVIVPICRNGNGGISDSGNCWPVSFATTFSKLFEHHILSYISTFVVTTDNQLSHITRQICVYINILYYIM